MKLTITVYCIENLPIFVECGKTCVHAGAVRAKTKQINGYYVGIHGSVSLTGVYTFVRWLSRAVTEPQPRNNHADIQVWPEHIRTWYRYIAKRVYAAREILIAIVPTFPQSSISCFHYIPSPSSAIIQSIISSTEYVYSRFPNTLPCPLYPT